MKTRELKITIATAEGVEGIVVLTIRKTEDDAGKTLINNLALQADMAKGIVQGELAGLFSGLAK